LALAALAAGARLPVSATVALAALAATPVPSAALALEAIALVQEAPLEVLEANTIT